jgi:hypothetical protein
VSRGRAAAGLGRSLTRWLTEPVPRDHWETDAAFAHRRAVVAATSVAGAGMLGVSLSTTPGSTRFYALTMGTAAVWAAGGAAAGPLHLGRARARDGSYRRPVVTPVLAGVGAFAAFYGCALVCRAVPPLDRALTEVLSYAHEGSDSLVMLTTLANGAAEELFFRGALYAAAGPAHPVETSTLSYLLATCATRNPALVLASGVMGWLLALQRRATGGVQAPLITHLTWSTLMLRFLPPLFRRRTASETGG